MTNFKLNPWLFLLLLIVFLFLIALGPILIIWALNTLFPALAIPYDFYTWAATVLLMAAIRTDVIVKR